MDFNESIAKMDTKDTNNNNGNQKSRSSNSGDLSRAPSAGAPRHLDGRGSGQISGRGGRGPQPRGGIGQSHPTRPQQQPGPDPERRRGPSNMRPPSVPASQMPRGDIRAMRNSSRRERMPRDPFSNHQPRDRSSNNQPRRRPEHSDSAGWRLWRKLKLCGNCRASNHSAMDCLVANLDGFIHACPICNMNNHTIDQCARKSSVDMFVELVENRGNKPPFYTTTDWYQLWVAKGRPLMALPYSVKFSRRLAAEDSASMAMIGMHNPKTYSYKHPCDPVAEVAYLPADPLTAGGQIEEDRKWVSLPPQIPSPDAPPSSSQGQGKVMEVDEQAVSQPHLPGAMSPLASIPPPPPKPFCQPHPQPNVICGCDSIPKHIRDRYTIICRRCWIAEGCPTNPDASQAPLVTECPHHCGICDMDRSHAEHSPAVCPTRLSCDFPHDDASTVSETHFRQDCKDRLCAQWDCIKVSSCHHCRACGADNIRRDGFTDHECQWNTVWKPLVLGPGRGIVVAVLQCKRNQDHALSSSIELVEIRDVGMERLVKDYNEWVKHGNKGPDPRKTRPIIECVDCFREAWPTGTFTEQQPDYDPLLYRC